jgi:hypothetical protein
VRSALAWKRYYETERASLGERGLDASLDRAAPVPLDRALVFPHTKASVSGHLVASAAAAIVRARVDRVVAIGVLHGAREVDAALVARARAGDVEARSALRGVHAANHPIASEEFSLDAFRVLLDRAAARAGRPAPRVDAFYPFLVGDSVADLPGLEALVGAADGAALVATTDPIHHGHGYGTRAPRSEHDDATRAWARGAIEAQLDALERGELPAFVATAELVRSDFRDVGPVLGHLLARGGAFRFAIEALELVDYADVLGAPSPTWVAAPLVRATSA